MIVDSSAIIAVLLGEDDAADLARILAESRSTRISAATYVECTVVVDARGNPVLSGRLDELLATNDIAIESVTPGQAEIARRAYRDFGRGSGHAAGLNYGDCFSYALAKERGEPLLYVGDDFAHTDIRSARTLPFVDPKKLRTDIDSLLDPSL